MKPNKKQIKNLNYKYRKAEREDQEDIFKLVKDVLSTYGLDTDPDNTDKDILNLNSFYFGKGGWFEIIENEDHIIIGSYGIYRISDTVCELRKMYLYEQYHGLGFGKEMMMRAFHKAKELGFEDMLLETNKVLNKALCLYKKFGFSEYHPKHLSDRCDIKMKRKL